MNTQVEDNRKNSLPKASSAGSDRAVEVASAAGGAIAATIGITALGVASIAVNVAIPILGAIVAGILGHIAARARE